MNNMFVFALLFSPMSAFTPIRSNLPSIIPQPVSMVIGTGEFTLNENTKIVVSKELERIAVMLQNSLQPATGLLFPIVGEGGAGSIYLTIDSSLSNLGDEGYRLIVNSNDIKISAPKPAGVFYGTQTLLQLLPPEIYKRAKQNNKQWNIPALSIEDYPRFSWRGSHLDVSRHFMPKEYLFKHIGLLAMHKMNVFHLHLTDDPGWRIEIKRYPKLTEVGAWRKDTMLTYDPPTFSGKPHGGFYTQDELRELVAYAAERFITIVPEIEMPGHCTAAIAAYPELGCEGKPIDVAPGWSGPFDVFNVEESTIEFLQNVLLEVMDIFPSTFIHIGGDEVDKSRWKRNERVQQRMKELGLKDEDELQSWFIKRMDDFLTKYGRRLVGWDEILEGGLAPGATVMSWRGMHGGIEAAKMGHDVVMAPTSHTYFDYYQSRRQDKEPHAIGGYLPLRRVYSFEPIPQELSPSEMKHILGVQAQIWTEYIPNPKHVEYMAFPRLSALAEVAWSKPENKNYENFLTRLYVHLVRKDILDVNYRKLDTQEEFPIGFWKSGETSQDFSVKTWDITNHISKEGEIEILFAYTHGAHRLDIAWAELLENGRVVSRDEHEGRTGGRNRDNLYRLVLPTYNKNAKYTLRASIRSDGGNDSNGEILLYQN